MPRIFRALGDEFKSRLSQKGEIPVNHFEGITSNGQVVLRDRRGKVRAEIPQVDTKSETLGDDPMAIYKPTGAKDVGADKAMANFTGWAYAAVNAIAMEAVGIQFRLYRVSGKDHEELEDHPLLDLLEFPNDTQIGLEFKYTMMAHLELTGNFYALMDGMNGPNSQPRSLFPLNPGRVRVKLDKSAFPYRIGHYEFTIDGKIYKFQPEKILHIRYPDPSDTYLGIGFPQTIPTWIDSDNYAMEYNRKYFLNGAQIGLYVQSDTNVEGQIDRIKRGMRDGYAGVENAHKIPVMPKGVKLEHTGVTHKDMDFPNLADRTRDRILAAARVSKTILGTAESDTNRATAETADYVFSKRTMKPKMDLIVAYLNAKLVPLFGDDLYLTFIDPTPEDREFRAKEMQAAVGNMPVMTQNEARKAYMGLGPVEGGDNLMMPNTMEPAGTTDQVEGEDQTPQLAKTATGWKAKAFRVRTGGKSVGSAYKTIQKELADLFKAKLDAAPEFQVKSVTDLTHTEYMDHWKRFDARSMEAYQEMLRVFHDINERQKREVVANLPESTGMEKALDQLFDLNKWVGITINLTTPILLRLARDEATSALAMIGANHQDILADEGIRQALEKGIAKMAHSYNETTLQQLEKVLGDEMAAEGGTSLPKLTDAVDGVYSFADERRAGLIAKTEAFRAANLANKDAWRMSGVVSTIKWYTAEDAKVCQYCSVMDGKEISIDDNFFNIGDTVKGTNDGLMTLDYSDVEAPPLHPDCRCFIRPQVIE